VSQPAAARSDIPASTLAVAALVLLLTALGGGWLMRTGRARTGRPDPAVTSGLEEPAPGAEPTAYLPPPVGGATVTFLAELGRAMVDSGASVGQVEASLRRVADVAGLGAAQVIVLPTALIVGVRDGEQVQTDITTAGEGLRLDQVDEVFRIVGAAERGEVTAAEGLAKLAAARAMAPRLPAPLRLAGYPLLAAGLVLILRGSPLELVLAAVLAAGTGALQLARGRLDRAYGVFVPVTAAFLVSFLVFALVRAGAPTTVYPVLIGPLVTFLPGALLTTAVLELATGQVMSGAGRLAGGATQLLLLALGILSAGQLVGVPAVLVGPQTSGGPAVIGPWVGVAVFGVGAVLANSARRASLPWIVLIAFVAYAGQVMGGLLLGAELSAFVGAAVMTPVAMVAASRPSGPPTLVTFLPAFWLLVPGATSLAGVTAYLRDDRVDGLASLLTAGATMVGISFGVLLGLALGTVLGLGSGVSVADRRRT
jgi:uncharacterized membrane protein YjjP (DUF1212 family)/uncharacterized membrane protein YjjB (DUF3815 family)